MGNSESQARCLAASAVEEMIKLELEAERRERVSHSSIPPTALGPSASPDESGWQLRALAAEAVVLLDVVPIDGDPEPPTLPPPPDWDPKRLMSQASDANP